MTVAVKHNIIIYAFLFRKTSILISYRSRPVCLSVQACARSSVKFLVNVFPPKPLDVATLTLHLNRSQDVEGSGQHFV